MKIYLAGGASVVNVKGRERELYRKMFTWKRLFSFHFKHWIINSEILQIAYEELNENILEEKGGTNEN